MTAEKSNGSTFRRRLLDGEELIGLFVKTPHHTVVEVMANSDLDFLVIDREHGAIDLAAMDTCLMAGRAADMPMLVRIQQNTATGMLYPLDCGATGVIVPHVATVTKAQEIANGGRYRKGNRGFAGTQRAGGYGTREMHEYIDAADAQSTIIAQIEDVEAVNNIEEIVKVDEIDCLFLGRMDLTVGYGARTQNDDVVMDAIKHVCKVARGAGKRIAAYSSPAERDMLRDLGVTVFAVGSEHNLIQKGITGLLNDFS
ncbi:MAG: aldolase/citrate lyase family protein [Emcibacteraceae bacterium]|nr:aldolase/citrate lyase family protein [Emcibacteraceae bacterium]